MEREENHSHNQQANLMLMESLSNGDINNIIQALNLDADINARDEDGYTSLHLALTYDRPDIATLLIENGADINASNHERVTPLYLALVNNYPNIAKLLIENGASIDVGNNNRSPLQWVCIYNQFDIAELLINNGADVNASDNYGWTPLYWALAKNRSNIVKLLLENGASIDDIISSQLYGAKHTLISTLISDMSNMESIHNYSRKTLAKAALQVLQEAKSKIEHQQSLSLGHVNILSILNDLDTPEKLLPQKIKDTFKFYTNPDTTKDTLKYFISIAFNSKKLCWQEVLGDVIASFLLDTTDTLQNINFTISFFSGVKNTTKSLHSSVIIAAPVIDSEIIVKDQIVSYCTSTTEINIDEVVVGAIGEIDHTISDVR